MKLLSTRVQYLALGMGASLAIVFLAQGQEDAAPKDRPNQVGNFMRAKLPFVHGIVDALATDDFNQLANNAQAIELLTLEEGWNVSRTMDYARYSEEFRRACQELKSAAQEKDINAATIAYVDMTFKCVKCHRHVRGTLLEGDSARGDKAGQE